MRPDTRITPGVPAQPAARRAQGEALFKAVVEKSPGAISLTGRDGEIHYLTPAAWQLLGWAPHEVDAEALRDQIVVEDRSRVARGLARMARRGGRGLCLEYRVRHRDGSVRWIELTGTNLLDDPDVGAIVGNHNDVTARKHAEAALHESRGSLEEAQALAHIGSWTSGIGPSDEIRWSRECYRIFGVAEGTPVTVESFFAHVHPADQERVQRASRDSTLHGEPFDIEHRVKRPDGLVRWVHERAVVERDAAGSALRMLGTVQDVTDRHLAVEALQASEERYRRIVENTSEGVWTCDAEGVLTFLNARMATLLGRRVEDSIGRPIYDFLTEASRVSAHTRIAAGQRGNAERLAAAFLHKDGSVVWASMQMNPLLDADGRFEGALALVTDVSAQRGADETRARLAAIVESSDDAIVSAALDGTITSWNRGAEKLYQYTADEVVGQPVSLLSPPSVPKNERMVLEAAARGEAVSHYETERRRRDGSVVEVALTVSPVRDAAGKVLGISKIARDLTIPRQTEAALRRTEEQFRQAQKMEAVGRLAAGVAHDFNNLLSVVLSYSCFALEELAVDDPLRSDIEQIVVAGNRATELTRQLLAFSRQQVLEPRVVDVNQVVSDLRPMLQRLLGEDIELTTLADPLLGRVLADPGQLEQVVMNLVVNARDAMPEGGALTIETLNRTLDAPYVGAHHGVIPGDYVVLAISDTGQGMDAATRARVFEPFFTTKARGKGTGLGLSTALGIVQQSGGHVEVYSELNQGCTFKIYLPRTDRSTVVTTPPATPKRLQGSETILLVEDESQVRAAACAILRRNGYNVLEASNGEQALRLAQEFGASIDLLLTDVVMPHMSGRKLSEQLAGQRPDMKVLFVSGYTDDAVVRHGVLEASVEFLQKPFTPDTLLRKVRAVLDAATLVRP